MDTTKNKRCSRCGLVKSTDAFHKNASAKDGRQSRCKPCHIETVVIAQRNNRPRRLLEQKRYRDKHRDRCKDSDTRWRSKDPERALRLDAEKARRWRSRHPEDAKVVSTKHTAKRRAACARSIPWADENMIKVVYEKAQKYSMHVDHIVPLNHPLVCGLHVWDNLQILEGRLNRQKNNRFWPEMPTED